jgi:MSHA biogenesis protein MshO
MRRSNTGFTLIEMIAVIVILSIISALGFSFVHTTLESYNATINRGKLITKGRLALERMTRQIRAAVPNSVRVVGDCVEFLPIAGGGNYVGTVPDVANGITALATITTATHSIDFGTEAYVVLGGLNTSEIYGASPASLEILSSRSSGNLVLSAAKQWQRNSLNQRFFLAEQPQAFCVNGTNLEYYAAYTGATSYLTTSIPSSGGDTVVDGVGAHLFTVSNGTEDRNTTLTIAMTFTGGGESVALNQEVYIRNVP